MALPGVAVEIGAVEFEQVGQAARRAPWPAPARCRSPPGSRSGPPGPRDALPGIARSVPPASAVPPRGRHGPRSRAAVVRLWGRDARRARDPGRKRSAKTPVRAGARAWGARIAHIRPFGRQRLRHWHWRRGTIVPQSCRARFVAAERVRPLACRTRFGTGVCGLWSRPSSDSVQAFAASASPSRLNVLDRKPLRGGCDGPVSGDPRCWAVTGGCGHGRCRVSSGRLAGDA